MSKSFGRSFRIDKSYSILAMKVFSSWDFRVIKKSSVELMSQNNCTQLRVCRSMLRETISTSFFLLFCPSNADESSPVWNSLQEILAEVVQKKEKNGGCQALWRLMVHGLAWAICIGGTAGCVISVYFFSEYMHQVRLPSCFTFMRPSEPRLLPELIFQSFVCSGI